MSIRQLIKPVNISLSDHFWNTFNNHETEASAWWIVKFAQTQGSGEEWGPFSLTQVQALYQQTFQGKTFRLNYLVDGDHISVDGDMITIHDSFISRIASNPKLVVSV